MSDLAAIATLIIATAELSAVRAVTRPIEANLAAAGGIKGALGTYTMPHGPSQTHGADGWTPTPNRPSIGPAARRQPTDIALHILQRREACTLPPPESSTRAAFVGDETRLANQPRQASDLTSTPRLPSPLLPPWRLPLPGVEQSVAPLVKWVAAPPDPNRRGRLVDVFL